MVKASLAVALALAASLGLARAETAPAPAVDDLSVVTASGPHHITVEVMRTRDELERGLMFRKTMAADHGMLFDFGEPQPVTMWMKNTVLPLDMLFIAKDGRIVSIKHNATPFSLAEIPSGGIVLGVLEVNAGTANRIGPTPGDGVLDPLSTPSAAGPRPRGAGGIAGSAASLVAADRAW